MSKIKGRYPKGIRVGRPRELYKKPQWKPKPKVMPFERLQQWIFDLGIRNEETLNLFRKSKTFPKYIQRSLKVRTSYPEHFTTITEFFNACPPLYLDYWQTKAMIDKHNLVGYKQYREFAQQYNKNRHHHKMFMRPMIVLEFNKVHGNQSWKTFFRLTIPVYLPFEEARAKVHSFNLSSKNQWNEFTKDPDFPTNIPKNPQTVYADQYTTDQNWLGISLMDKLEVKDEYYGVWTIIRDNNDPVNYLKWIHFPLGYTDAKQWCDKNDHSIYRVYKYEQEYAEHADEIIEQNSTSFVKSMIITSNFDQLRYYLDITLLVVPQSD